MNNNKVLINLLPIKVKQTQSNQNPTKAAQLFFIHKMCADIQQIDIDRLQIKTLAKIYLNKAYFTKLIISLFSQLQIFPRITKPKGEFTQETNIAKS